jgi:tetratricopeptide (TPR) repeat protein
MAAEKAFTGPPSLSRPDPPVYTFGQLWQVPLFLLGLVALLTLWAIRPLWYDPEIARLRGDLEKARRTLQDPRAALNGLTVLLNDALGHVGRLPDRAGEAHFLLGSTYLCLAEQVPAEAATDLWHKARSQLQEAEQRGVPENDRPLLRYRLGMAWYHTGGDVQRVIDYLSAVVDQVEEDRAAGYDALTQCYLRLPKPNLVAALQANAMQLQLPTADESRLAPARLLRGELLLRMKDGEAARKFLAKIKDAPPEIVAKARALRARSYQDEETWSEAAKLWEEALADPRQPPTDRGQILYLLGCCYRNLHRSAEAARFWKSATHQNGEVGQAASLRLANLQIETGDLPAALELYERALAAVPQSADYHNSLVSLQEVGNLLASDCRTCKDSGKFADALKLARQYAKLVAPAPAQVLLGQVAEAWAAAQLAQSRQLKEAAKAQELAEAARAHFREAALAYERAAQATIGQSNHKDWLWQAAACFLKGEEFRHAITAYQHFMEVQPRPPSAQLSEAWYRLGEAQRALHDDHSAAESYKKCIEVDGVFAYWARYRHAQIEFTAGHAKDAQEMLEQNLELIEQAGATVDRSVHEKTLFALAEILFWNREFNSAAWHYEKALPLYPASLSAYIARYHLAQCYLHSAREFQHLQPSDQLSTPNHYRGSFNFYLEKAAVQFQILVDDLQARQATSPLAEADAKMLTQARFALADCRYSLGHFLDAIPIYSSLANQYHQRVEGLHARRELYRCYVALMELEQKPGPNLQLAQDALEDMRQSLDQLDDAAFQGRPEAEQRAVWARWIKNEEETLQRLGFVMPPK